MTLGIIDAQNVRGGRSLCPKAVHFLDAETEMHRGEMNGRNGGAREGFS